MATRLTHAAIAFAVTAALYQAYVVTIVPFVDPPAPRHAPGIDAAAAVLIDAGDVSEKYRPLLKLYFSIPGRTAEHWSLRGPLKVAESDQVLIAFNEYQRTESGQLTLPRCVVIYFPSGRDRGTVPPRDAIILEPSEGAVVQMDRRFGGPADIGRFQFGQLLGDIVVRSDMRDPGPQDDLLMTTRNIYINENVLRTAEPVEMRLGKNFFRGRLLEIHRIQTEGGPSAPNGFFGGFDSLEISQEVEVTLSPESVMGLRSRKTPDDSDKPPGQADRMFEAPVHITCTGPFRFDFSNTVATFSEQVVAREIHPDGARDELRAEELNVFFSPNRERAARAENAKSLWSTLPEPSTIEARGSSQSSVRVIAQSLAADLDCQRLWIQLRQMKARSILIEAGEGQEVSLNYKGAAVRAPFVEYSFPPPDSTATIGSGSARGGPGRIHYVDPNNPERVIDIEWKESLRLARINGQLVLSLESRPHLSMLGMGELYADSLRLLLRERRPEEYDEKQAAKVAALPASIAAQRLEANGRVAIRSAELSCKVNDLNLKFDYPAAVAGSEPATRAPVDGSPFGDVGSRSRGGPPQRNYDITGNTLKAACVVRENRPELTSLRVEGSVQLLEQATELQADPPMRVLAERLELKNVNTPETEITISGGGGQDGIPYIPTEIVAGGTTLRAPAIWINRGTGQARIDSAGEIEMLVDRDLTGQPLATPQPLNVQWQQSMELENRRITFHGDVLVRNGNAWLQTQRLVAQTTGPIISGASSTGAKPQLEQIECWGRAVAEFDQRDAQGTTSHQRFVAESLAVNQVSGEISGSGPGVVDSVHLATTSASLLGSPVVGGGPGLSPPIDNPVDAAAAAEAPGLRRLHIEFARAITGNLLKRNVQLAGDVRTVYGPVSSWDQPLVMSAGGAPPQGVIWIKCDQLGVTESPLGRIEGAGAATKRGLGPVELLAEGRVVIEGQDARRGGFTLRGGRATYDQVKTMFVLQGDGRLPATITHQQFLGAPPSEQSAQKLIYWQSTGEVSIQGVNKIQWNQFDVGRQPDTTPR